MLGRGTGDMKERARCCVLGRVLTTLSQAPFQRVFIYGSFCTPPCKFWNGPVLYSILCHLKYPVHFPRTRPCTGTCTFSSHLECSWLATALKMFPPPKCCFFGNLSLPGVLFRGEITSSFSWTKQNDPFRGRTNMIIFVDEATEWSNMIIYLNESTGWNNDNFRG